MPRMRVQNNVQEKDKKIGGFWCPVMWAEDILIIMLQFIISDFVL